MTPKAYEREVERQTSKAVAALKELTDKKSEALLDANHPEHDHYAQDHARRVAPMDICVMLANDSKARRFATAYTDWMQLVGPESLGLAVSYGCKPTGEW